MFTFHNFADKLSPIPQSRKLLINSEVCNNLSQVTQLVSTWLGFKGLLTWTQTHVLSAHHAALPRKSFRLLMIREGGQMELPLFASSPQTLLLMFALNPLLLPMDALRIKQQIRPLHEDHVWDIIAVLL